MAVSVFCRRTAESAIFRASALVFLGAAGSTGHVPFSLPLATIAAFYLAAAIGLRRSNWIGAAKSGWFFGFGYFAGTLSWIVEPFLVDFGKNGWMAPFAIIFTAGGFALFWASAFGFARRFGAGVPARALLLIAGITGIEFLRSELFSGFPWGLVGYIWSETPVIQASAFCGPYAMVAFTVLASVLPLATRRAWAGALASFAGVFALWVFGQARMDSVESVVEARPQVRVVQPNVPQRLKWKLSRREEFFGRLLDLTREGGEPHPDLIVWPETAATFLVRSERGRFSRIAEAANGAIVALGIRRMVGKLDFNSMIALDKNGLAFAVYDKYRLVPFGEYFPLGNYLSWLGAKGLATREGHGFTSGPGPELLDLRTAGSYLPLICYEAIFPRGMRTEDRPDALLQITNDGWFGRFSGPQQHLAQARLRSIEQGLPLVRSANTGISAIVDSYGRIVASLGLGETGFFDAPLPARLPPTVYSKYGDWPWLAALLAFAVAISRTKRNSVN
ncbi:MAG: apolipoprotein N-acyltransferase [Albidovulum sp.]|nr:apolipoprotein N-acyltransferase [Albidovulum sp.]MDE0533235.1 apolipoprotein N-acyltransferase [Albidovulum sp.]